MTTLSEALTEAGVKSPADMARLARTDIDPAAAVLDLQRRYPSQFSVQAPPDPSEWMSHDTRRMSDTELRAWERKLQDYALEQSEGSAMRDWYRRNGIQTGEHK